MKTPADLAAAIESAFPTAKVQIEAPIRPDGMFHIDARLEDKFVTITWDAARRIGVSLLREPTLETGPDHHETDPKIAFEHVVRMLRGVVPNEARSRAFAARIGQHRAVAGWFAQQVSLKNPHIELSGVFNHGTAFRIVVEGLTKLKAHDGLPLSKWCDQHRPLGTDVRVIDHVPEGWERLPEQSLRAFLLPTSALKPVRDVFADLALLLPRGFPDFNLRWSDFKCQIEIARSLETEETAALTSCFEQLQLGVQPEIVVNPTFVPDPFRRHTQGDLLLIPARRLPPLAGSSLRSLWDEDEGSWRGHESSLYYQEEVQSSETLLPETWRTKCSRCIVPTAVFTAQNIRNYLSLYREVILVAPLEGSAEKILASIGCSERELLRLLETQRVRLLLPQSVDRYDLRFLSEAAEVAPHSLLFSRRLAAATIADARRRVPFLYPPASPDQRRVVLRFILELARSAPDEIERKVLEAVAFELGRIYADGESMIQARGAIATGMLGIGGLAGQMYKAGTGRDLVLEFWSAATAVEWGALLNATVFPVRQPKYSEERASEIVASAYSGVNPDSTQPVANELLEVLRGILSIDNDAPIDDVVQAFGGGDIDRLRQLVSKIITENTDEVSKAAAIEDFNALVRRFEKDVKKTKEWDVVGLMGVTSAVLIPGPAKYVGLGLWLLKRLQVANRLGAFKSETVGRLVDRLNAPAIGGSPDVVLVSRLKDNLKG